MEVGEGRGVGEAGGERVEVRERRGGGEGAEEGKSRRRRGRNADAAERDHRVVGWRRRRGGGGGRGAEAEAQRVDEARAAEVGGHSAAGRGHRVGKGRRRRRRRRRTTKADAHPKRAGYTGRRMKLSPKKKPYLLGLQESLQGSKTWLLNDKWFTLKKKRQMVF